MSPALERYPLRRAAKMAGTAVGSASTPARILRSELGGSTQGATCRVAHSAPRNRWGNDGESHRAAVSLRSPELLRVVYR